MNKKILKYKVKKNKLENEILDILGIKKANYENEIAKLNNNQLINEKIESFLNLLKSSQSVKLIIFVSGNYSVGKSTFISHLENYILRMFKIIFNVENIENKDLIKKITYPIEDVQIVFSNKIIIVEINNNNFINNENMMLNIINSINQTNTHITNTIKINIVPKDKKTLKNKFINKILQDIKNNTNAFITEFNSFDSSIKTDIKNNIHTLKLKKNIYSDNDFLFLDKVVEHIFDFELSIFSDEKYQSSDTIKYYL